MKISITEIEAVLNRLVARNVICAGSVQFVLRDWSRKGKVIPINQKNLQKAIEDRGSGNFRSFFAELLGWPGELQIYLRNLEDKIWSKDLGYGEQMRRIRAIHIAAVLAWIEESEKP